MRGPIIGSEAIAAGVISRGALRWNYTAVHPDVYLLKDARRDLHARTAAAWLWTRRNGVVAGRAAAALHGVPWIDDTVPIELISKGGRASQGVVIREERIADDEIVRIARLAVTSPARTALELARHLPRDAAVAHMDALAGVTGVTRDDVRVLADRYRGARGLQGARNALELMDGGARSPEESRLRLQLIDAGLPRPRTKIRVADDLWEATIAMGWEGPKVGVSCYNEESADRVRAIHETATADLLQRLGWMHFRVVRGHTEKFAIRRIWNAVRQRGRP